jgi:hypothetical protein
VISRAAGAVARRISLESAGPVAIVEQRLVLPDNSQTPLGRPAGFSDLQASAPALYISDAMKTDRWLALSLILNGMLGAVVVSLMVYRAPSKVPPPAGSSAAPIHTANPRAAAAEDDRVASTPVVVGGTAPNAAEWPRWLDQLKRAGVSQKVIAGLVVSDFEARWERRVRDLQERSEKGELDADALGREHAKHDEELENELRVALDEDGFRAWDRENTLRDLPLDRLGLEPAARDTLYALRKNLLLERRQLEEAHRAGTLDDQDLEQRSSKLQTEYQRKLQEVLGDEGYSALNSPGDGATVELKREFKGVPLVDAQFDALLDVRHATDALRSDLERQSEANPSRTAEFEARSEALEAFRNQEYQRVLGPEAFAQFQRDNDQRYQTMKRYASTWNLSSGEIENVYGTLQSYEKAVRDYRQQALQAERQGQHVDWTEVGKTIDQISQQGEQALRASLGDDRFARMKRSSVLFFGQ